MSIPEFVGTRKIEGHIIALCQTLNKIVSKLMDVRMQHILSKNIWEDQGLLMKGWRIQDKISLTNEFVDKLSKSKQPSACQKFNNSSTYDRVS